MQLEFKSLLSVIFLDVKWYSSCRDIYSKIKDNLVKLALSTTKRERGETGATNIEPTLFTMRHTILKHLA